MAARLIRPFLDLGRKMDRELGRSFHDLVREEGWLPFGEREYALGLTSPPLAGMLSLRSGSPSLRPDCGVRAARE